MPTAHLRLILESNKEQNARRVLSRLGKLIRFDLQELHPYSKGGFEANVTITISASDHSAIVLDVIEIAQAFGRGWQLNGYIKENVDLTCSEFCIVGIEFAWLNFDYLDNLS